MADKTKVITTKVRFSYCHVFKAHSVEEGGRAKFGVSIIIDKKDTKLLKKIKDAIEVAKEEGKGKWGGKIPKVLKTPLRDGDEKEDDEAYEGKFFLNANSNRKPGLVDADMDEIIDPDEFYSGCYGRASMNFYAYNSNGNKGIACGLSNLQKLEDGEKLGGGGSSAADDFGTDDDDDDMLG